MFDVFCVVGHISLDGSTIQHARHVKLHALIIPFPVDVKALRRPARGGVGDFVGFDLPPAKSLTVM
ncbi:MAG: hypothetical protein ACPH5G_16225, partial [Pseudooceanicola atlanticus]